MSEQVPEGQGVPDSITQGFVQGQGQDTGSELEGINPAWNDMLNDLPAEYHSKVAPHLQQWDKSVNKRFEQVHSRYNDYDPFVEAGVRPEEINFGLGLAEAISNNPQEVLEALTEYIKEEGLTNSETGQGGGGQGQENLPQSDPRLDQMEQVIRVLAQNTIQSREEQEQQLADQEWEAELEAARNEHGPFDEDYVTYLMFMNEDLEINDAIQAAREKENEIRSQSRRPGPNVLGPGGAVPSRNIDVKALNDGETKKLAADMLAEFLDGG